MAGKKPFALRIDAGMLEAIEKWAADEFRSVNGQIEWILNKALRESGRLKEKAARDLPGGQQTGNDAQGSQKGGEPRS